MTHPADLSVIESSARLDRGDISSEELVRATLDRMDETEPRVHAYAHRFDERALAEARSADRRPRQGPLHGIPFAVKDTLSTEGTPTEAGAAILRGNLGTFDATAVRRLRQAGAILVGKHVTHEFAQGQEALPTRNPWDETRFPGGSSAGSGVSVAVRSAPLAIGTDAGGSTRMPAALTGVVGLKPTYGRVSTYGTVPGAAVPGAEHVGIFTRTAGDAALALFAIAGADLHDARTADLPPFRMPAHDGVRGLRIGVIERLDMRQRIAPTVENGVSAAVEVLKALGATLVPTELNMDLAGDALSLLVATSAAAPHWRGLRDNPEAYSAPVRRHLRAALLIPARHLRAAQSARSAARAQVCDLFERLSLDLLAMPTLPCLPPLLSEFNGPVDMGWLTSFTAPWNLTGQPALSLPCGHAGTGLPVGLQLVGRPLDEVTILQAGIAYQSVTNWHLLSPPGIGARS